MNITQKQRNAINQRINVVNKQFHPHIPINDIFAACTDNGITPVQEDGTPWSGLFCGEQGTAHIDLMYEKEPVSNCVLVIGWYKMPSGNYEMNCYLS